MFVGGNAEGWGRGSLACTASERAFVGRFVVPGRWVAPLDRLEGLRGACGGTVAGGLRGRPSVSS